MSALYLSIIGIYHFGLNAVWTEGELVRFVVLSVCEDDSQQEIVATNRTLLEENSRFQDLASSLQGRHHKMSLEVNVLGIFLYLFVIILY